MRGIYFIYEGIAKVHKHWGGEKDLIVRFARKGDILGHRGLGSDTLYPVSATAIEPVTACFVELEFFLSTLKVNHSFTYNLMMFYAAELKESERKMSNLVHMPVKGRLAYTLLFLKERFGVTADGFIDITLSRQDIASFAGTTYETAFRMFTEMINDNVIAVSGKSFSVLDEGRLKAYMAGND